MTFHFTFLGGNEKENEIGNRCVGGEGRQVLDSPSYLSIKVTSTVIHQI